MAQRPRDCPCGSSARYTACCGPLHDGERVAASPETLMRSRFAAFAVGAGEYLVATLSSDHPDRKIQNLARDLARAKEKQRFLALRVFFATENGDEGEVLFFAKIFEKGIDRSFAELSRFVREDGAWRYASGESIERARLPKDLDTLDRDTFIELLQHPSIRS